MGVGTRIWIRASKRAGVVIGVHVHIGTDISTEWIDMRKIGTDISIGNTDMD